MSNIRAADKEIRYNDTELRFKSVSDFIERGISKAPLETSLVIKLVGKTLNSTEVNQLSSSLAGRQVKEIDFTYCGLNDEMAPEISNILKNHPEIKKIRLYGNSIGDEGARKIVQIKLPTTEINWKKNSIGAAGACAIVETAILQGARSVDLSNNLIGDMGAQEVANLFKKGRGELEQLVLVGNKIGADGDKALAEQVESKGVTVIHLKKKTTLGKLFPRVCKITAIVLAIICPLTLFLVLPVVLFMYVFKFSIPEQGCTYHPQKTPPPSETVAAF